VRELSIDFGKHSGSNTAIFSSLVDPVLDMCIKSTAVGDIYIGNAIQTAEVWYN